MHYLQQLASEPLQNLQQFSKKNRTEESNQPVGKADRLNKATLWRSAIWHLVRKNMMNVKLQYKRNKCNGIYDSDYDSYCSLVSYRDFTSNIGHYVDLAYQKRNELYKYNIKKRM